jgi:hypothetical protein
VKHDLLEHSKFLLFTNNFYILVAEGDTFISPIPMLCCPDAISVLFSGHFLDLQNSVLKIGKKNKNSYLIEAIPINRKPQS